MAKKAKETQAKREAAWAGRDKRVKKKLDDKVQRALELIPEIKRKAKLVIEKNNEYLQDWEERRWPIFGAQLERMRERENQRNAEADAVRLYHEQRSIPKKEKVKGKKGKAKAGGKKKDGKKAKESDDGGEEKVDSKKDAEKIVDGVEAKMRDQMAEMKRRSDLNAKREAKVAEKETRTKAVELSRINDYKKKVQLQEEARISARNERRVIQASKEDERLRAEERQQEEENRRNGVRAKHVLEYERKQLEWLMSH